MRQQNDQVVESTIAKGVSVIRASGRPRKSIKLPEKKKLRVAAYCRVSKDIEVQESSLDTQMETYSRRAFFSLNYTFHHPFHMIYVQCHDHISKFFNPLCIHNPKILPLELVPKLVHQIEHHFIHVIGEEHYSRSVLQRASRQCLSVQLI